MATPLRLTNVVGRFDQPVVLAVLLNAYRTFARWELDSVLRNAFAAAVAFAVSEVDEAAATAGPLVLPEPADEADGRSSTTPAVPTTPARNRGISECLRVFGMAA